MQTKLVPVDIGHDLYTTMRKPNWLRYQWRKAALFFGIVSWLPWKWNEEGYISPVLIILDAVNPRTNPTEALCNVR